MHWSLRYPNEGKNKTPLCTLYNSTYISVAESEEHVKNEIRNSLQNKKPYKDARLNVGQYHKLLRNAKNKGERIDLTKFKNKAGFCKNHSRPVKSHCSHPRLCENCLVEELYIRISDMKYNYKVSIHGLSEVLDGYEDKNITMGIVISMNNILIYPNIDHNTFSPRTTDIVPFVLENAKIATIYKTEEMHLLVDKNIGMRETFHTGYIYGMGVCKTKFFGTDCQSKSEITIYGYNINESIHELFTYDQCYGCTQKNVMFSNALRQGQHIFTSGIGREKRAKKDRQTAVKLVNVTKNMRAENERLKETIRNLQNNKEVDSETNNITEQKINSLKLDNHMMRKTIEELRSELNETKMRHDSIYSSIEEKCDEYVNTIDVLIRQREASVENMFKKSNRDFERKLMECKSRFMNSFRQ